MYKNHSSKLPVAVRVYPEPPITNRNPADDKKRWRRPDAMFVFDTETRTDATQSLTFGCYRYIVKGVCLEEGLFYASDTSESELAILREYVSQQNTEHPRLGLLLVTKSEFLRKLYKAAYKGRCLLVGFNLSFDLARIAFDFGAARRRFMGGFSLGIWSYVDEQGRERRHPYRPRVAIKQIDSKRGLRGFTSTHGPDSVDLIPEESKHGTPVPGYTFRGHFLDLRTLAFALTDRSYSLEAACKAFGVEHGKMKAPTHGVITDEYIDYNRRDVQATYELAVKLLREYGRHPIKLQITKAYSPASIGKAYLRAMGIQPILERQTHFPKHILGYAQSAFFGGRTSAHIRKFAVPVVYTDFLSMYPTVNSLMDLWRFVVANEIRCVEHCTTEIIDFLGTITSSRLFVQDTWKMLTAFVKVIPNGDILPSRAKYSTDSNDWQMGVNHLYTGPNNGEQGALWFSLPDVVASVILTGRIPEIVDAFRLEAVGLQPGIRAVKLRGEIGIDPGNEDFFKVVIEQRKRLSKRTDLSQEERERLDKALKVLANAASYGIYAEMNVQESEERVRVSCHGIDPEAFTCSVAHPEVPGTYCFPPLASLITGAARLMLALLEQSVTEIGGTYALEDTDSMAILAAEEGGVIPCPVGRIRTRKGNEAIQALSWAQVKTISERFASLNPYDREVIPGSVLKVEDVNVDPSSKHQRQIQCFAISAKRYALFLPDDTGSPQLLRLGCNSNSNGWKEHGLGHLLNPSDPESEDREWIAKVWLDMIRRSFGLPASELAFSRLPAVGRVTISSPAVMKAFRDFNTGKSYREQIKPFNFLLTAQTIPFGHPIGADPSHFHLIATYESDPRKWSRLHWIDQYTGKTYHISTDACSGSRGTARVKTYGDVLDDYEYHPEPKCANAQGNVCGKQTVGLLYRRHIEIERVVYIGKESNRLEDVESGMIRDESEVYTEYPDPRRDEWAVDLLPKIRAMTLAEVIRISGCGRRTVIDWRAGRSRPHPLTLAKLKSTLQRTEVLVSDEGPAGIFNAIAHLINLFKK